MKRLLRDFLFFCLGAMSMVAVFLALLKPQQSQEAWAFEFTTDPSTQCAAPPRLLAIARGDRTLEMRSEGQTGVKGWLYANEILMEVWFRAVVEFNLVLKGRLDGFTGSGTWEGINPKCSGAWTAIRESQR